MQQFVSSGVALTTSGNDQSSGNGSIMRLAAVPVAFHDNLAVALEVAEQQSRTTHRGIEAAECCKLMTTIIISAINDPEMHASAKQLIDSLIEKNAFQTPVPSVDALFHSLQEGDNKDRNWNWKVPRS